MWSNVRNYLTCLYDHDHLHDLLKEDEFGYHL